MHTCVLVGLHVCFFSDINMHDCLCICGITLTTAMPTPLYSYHLAHHPLCLPSGPDAHDGGGSLSSCAIFQRARQMTWRPNLKLARGSADSVLAATCTFKRCMLE